MAEFHLSANEVLTRLADQATSSMDDFLSASGRGVRIDLLKAKRNGKLHLLKSYSKVKGGVKIELYDAHAALVDVGKHLKLFADQLEVTGKDGGPIELTDTLTDEQRAERIALLLAKVEKRQSE